MTDELIQTRIARARAIHDAVPAEDLVRGVAQLFDFAEAGGDDFTYPALPSTSRDRIFGGQVIAQAMMAAARTVEPEKQIHSLHAYFLRGGDETKELHFRVHRDFDGRSFANRRVVVRQADKVIFNLTASFQAPAPGYAHQRTMPDVLPPEQCPDFLDLIAADPTLSDAVVDRMAKARPFEMRSFRPEGGQGETYHYQWMRAAAPLGDDPLIHRAFLAYASDMGLLSSSLLPHGLNWSTPGLFTTSLDHAMWFHNDLRADEWFVFVMHSDWTGGARGINHGSVYRQDGTLIASAVQEGLLRQAPAG